MCVRVGERRKGDHSHIINSITSITRADNEKWLRGVEEREGKKRGREERGDWKELRGERSGERRGLVL